jgi:hypothetical protein
MTDTKPTNNTGHWESLEQFKNEGLAIYRKHTKRWGNILGSHKKTFSAVTGGKNNEWSKAQSGIKVYNGNDKKWTANQDTTLNKVVRMDSNGNAAKSFSPMGGGYYGVYKNEGGGLLLARVVIWHLIVHSNAFVMQKLFTHSVSLHINSHTPQHTLSSFYIILIFTFFVSWFNLMNTLPTNGPVPISATLNWRIGIGWQLNCTSRGDIRMDHTGSYRTLNSCKFCQFYCYFYLFSTIHQCENLQLALFTTLGLHGVSAGWHVWVVESGHSHLRNLSVLPYAYYYVYRTVQHLLPMGGGYYGVYNHEGGGQLLARVVIWHFIVHSKAL